MAFVSEEEFLKIIKPEDRILGLDVGTKTIGVAVGSGMGGFASPLDVIQRTKIARDAALLKQFMDDYAVVGLVVGWPLNVDGTVGPRCQGVRDVMIEIMKYIPACPVTFHDERFSTQKAEQFMISEIDMSRHKRNEIVDKMAAQIILQNFIEQNWGA